MISEFEVFVFTMCYTWIIFAIGFLGGYGYRKELTQKFVEDLSGIVYYLDPDGSKRNLGLTHRANELKKLAADTEERNDY